MITYKEAEWSVRVHKTLESARSSTLELEERKLFGDHIIYILQLQSQLQFQGLRVWPKSTNTHDIKVIY